jgi:WD40 repeat protein
MLTSDVVVTVHAMQAESQIFSTSGSDRSVALYDLRSSSPLRKLVLQTCSNAIAWNPMEPLNFVVANEDCNLYSYDMRKLSGATCVHEVCVCKLYCSGQRLHSKACFLRRTLSECIVKMPELA